MDPVTQGLLGASLAGSLSKKKQTRAAIFAGTIGGLFPDFDILIKSNIDPLLAIEYHRNFSHSLVFIPFGGLIVTFFLFLFLRTRLSFRYIYFFSTLGILTHGFLDACTSYGTSLFWPFSSTRVSWNVISIVDPFFLLILLFSVSIGFYKISLRSLKIGFFLSLLYLSFSFFKHQQVKSYIKEIALTRGHKIDKILLNPTIGNNILWRTIYKSNNKFYVDVAYIPFLHVSKFKRGNKTNVIDVNQVFPEIELNSLQRNDIKRFAFFSQDFIYLHPKYKNVLADLRYGTLPHDLQSLWGIEINPSKPDEHVKFKNLRNFKNNDYKNFWNMLKGNLY